MFDSLRVKQYFSTNHDLERLRTHAVQHAEEGVPVCTARHYGGRARMRSRKVFVSYHRNRTNSERSPAEQVLAGPWPPCARMHSRGRALPRTLLAVGRNQLHYLN